MCTLRNKMIYIYIVIVIQNNHTSIMIKLLFKVIANNVPIIQTNKSDYGSQNIINAGINATSQLNAIKKFLELNEIKKTIFLTPNVSYKNKCKLKKKDM